MHYSQSHGKDKNWYVEARLHYKHSFGLNNVEGMAQFGQHRTFYPGSYPGIPMDRISTVGRLKYNYNRRYLLQFSMGYNGSENFKEGRRFGFFPAIAGGWIVTNEPFMPETSFLSSLKLRASWGRTGNDRGIGRFLYLPTVYNASADGYSFGTDVPQDKPGASEGSIGNPLVTWETSVKRNYGINMGMFNDRLELQFTYFHELRSNILIHRSSVPNYVAADLPAVNLGKLRNKGFEAKISWKQQVGDFFYSIGANGSLAHDKILFEDEVPPIVPWQSSTGRPVGQHFGYVFEGFYNKEEVTNSELAKGVPVPTWEVKRGFLKYKDVNGDGAVNTKDKVPIGYPNVPEFNIGSTLNLGYKNWSLSMTWASAFHVSKYLSGTFKFPFGQQGRSAMVLWQYKGRWTQQKVDEGKKITYPRLSLASKARVKNEQSTFWLANARYIRLKSLQIGYDFSPSFLKDIGIGKLQVFAKGYNLITFSPMLRKYQMDPERNYDAFSQPTAYPISKIYNFGIRVSF
jgi:TonB-linked SusC/RagA family outer membrane protein